MQEFWGKFLCAKTGILRQKNQSTGVYVIYSAYQYTVKAVPGRNQCSILACVLIPFTCTSTFQTGILNSILKFKLEWYQLFLA